MPVYEYKCPKCEHKFEELVKHDAPPPACPECGNESTEKQVSISTFKLKGGGWAEDGY